MIIYKGPNSRRAVSKPQAPSIFLAGLSHKTVGQYAVGWAALFSPHPGHFRTLVTKEMLAVFTTSYHGQLQTHFYPQVMQVLAFRDVTISNK